jgi:hypothetical protein
MTKWLDNLIEIIKEQVLYPLSEDYLISGSSTIESVVETINNICSNSDFIIEEPYFDVAPDGGIDVYFDINNDELLIHVPPVCSENKYCFSRINDRRVVHRNPTVNDMVELLRQIKVLNDLKM